jgi:hypothetical protein
VVPSIGCTLVTLKPTTLPLSSKSFSPNAMRDRQHQAVDKLVAVVSI